MKYLGILDGVEVSQNRKYMPLSRLWMQQDNTMPPPPNLLQQSENDFR